MDVQVQVTSACRTLYTLPGNTNAGTLVYARRNLDFQAARITIWLRQLKES